MDRRHDRQLRSQLRSQLPVPPAAQGNEKSGRTSTLSFTQRNLENALNIACRMSMNLSFLWKFDSPGVFGRLLCFPCSCKSADSFVPGGPRAIVMRGHTSAERLAA